MRACALPLQYSGQEPCHAVRETWRTCLPPAKVTGLALTQACGYHFPSLSDERAHRSLQKRQSPPHPKGTERRHGMGHAASPQGTFWKLVTSLCVS